MVLCIDRFWVFGRSTRRGSIFQSGITIRQDSLQNAALEISDAALQNLLNQAWHGLGLPKGQTVCQGQSC